MDAPFVRAATVDDAPAIVSIYNHYILNTTITFEEQALSAESMSERIREITSIPLPWLVAEKDGTVFGYAYASKWKGRCAYRYSVESTVYVDPAFVGQRIGTQLYTALFDKLSAQSIHVVIGGIALPNPASVAIHERFGLEKVAHFREVGFKFERWIDVGYWQKIL